MVVTCGHCMIFVSGSVALGQSSPITNFKIIVTTRVSSMDICLECRTESPIQEAQWRCVDAQNRGQRKTYEQKTINESIYAVYVYCEGIIFDQIGC